MLTIMKWKYLYTEFYRFRCDLHDAISMARKEGRREDYQFFVTIQKSLQEGRWAESGQKNI